MDDSYTFKGLSVKNGRRRTNGVGLVFGIGVSDVKFVKPFAASRDPYYIKWKKMLERAYDAKCISRQETYSGVRVCDEWLTFSNFNRWMFEQDWQGKELDKDILGDGTLYSPETCAFILDKTNNFLREPSRGTEKWPVGVAPTGYGRFSAQVSDFTIGKQNYLGSFDTPEEAHLAWLKRKRELACILADMETDPRVKVALRERYKEENYVQRRRVRE